MRLVNIRDEIRDSTDRRRGSIRPCASCDRLCISFPRWICSSWWRSRRSSSRRTAESRSGTFDNLSSRSEGTSSRADWRSPRCIYRAPSVATGPVIHRARGVHSLVRGPVASVEVDRRWDSHPRSRDEGVSRSLPVHFERTWSRHRTGRSLSLHRTPPRLSISSSVRILDGSAASTSSNSPRDDAHECLDRSRLASLAGCSVHCRRRTIDSVRLWEEAVTRPGKERWNKWCPGQSNLKREREVREWGSECRRTFLDEETRMASEEPVAIEIAIEPEWLDAKTTLNVEQSFLESREEQRRSSFEGISTCLPDRFVRLFAGLVVVSGGSVVSVLPTLVSPSALWTWRPSVVVVAKQSSDRHPSLRSRRWAAATTLVDSRRCSSRD